MRTLHPRKRFWMTVAAAVLIAVATGAGVRIERHLAQQAAAQQQERVKAELAQQQFALAMQVTSRTLVEARNLDCAQAVALSA